MEIEFTSESATLRISGIPAGAFNRRLKSAIGRAVRDGHYELVVDLTGVEILDSAALGTFADAVRTSKPLGVKLAFRFPERARRIASIAGLPLAA